jgi:GntR family transcriptional regulator
VADRPSHSPAPSPLAALSRPVTLDRHSGEPAHLLIERWFLAAIASGELVAGDRVPREQDLAATFGVSRMTLRQALSGLEQRGVIDRVPGRSGGTFIRQPKIECDLTGLAGFTEQLRRANVRAGSATTGPASRVIATALRLPRDGPVHHIVRVRSANREPLALESSYFPAVLFPDLLSHRLTGSLYALLTRRYHHEPRTALEYLDPVSASPEEAATLEMAPGAPLIAIERTAYTAGGVPVEHARDLFRPDRVRISVRSGLPG